MNGYRRLLAAGMVGALAVTGCGDADGAGDSLSAEERGVGDADRQALVEAMVSEGAAGQEAVCFIDELGLEVARRIFEADDASLSDSDVELAAAALEKCSEGDGSADLGDESTGSNDGEASGAEGLAAARSCLEDEGLQVESSPVPEDLQTSLGIVATITVFTDDGGTGAITLYDSVDAATEAREAESDLEGDGVAFGQFNEVVYVYTGDEAGLFAIEGCL